MTSSPIIVPNTQWPPADPSAYDGGRPPTITHLAELELQDKGDNGRWGALDVIPTTADYLLDLSCASTASGRCCPGSPAAPWR